NFGLGVTFAAGNDCPGMAHAPAGWRGAAGDEPDHPLPAGAPCLVFQELPCIPLGRAADLPDHDNRLGFWIGQEHLEHRDKFRTFHRVAAYADSGGLAKVLAAGLEHRLVGERARARHDAYLARLEDIARHDADLAFTRGHHARAVRADQPRFRTRERALHLDHIHHRNAFGD